MQPIWGSKHNLYNWPHVVVYRPNWQKGLITQTRDLIFCWPNDTTFSTFCCFGATVKRQKQSVTPRVFSWEILLICCRSCHILKTTVASLNKTVYGPALLHFPHSTSHYVGDFCSVSAQSLVAGADSWDPLPPPRLSLSLPPSLSLSQQLLQVIDDLIRMLPAAPRLTLKDFPYAMPQTANGARATRRCQRTFPNGLLVEEIKERAVLSSCPLFYAQTRNCVSSGTWKFEPFLN